MSKDILREYARLLVEDDFGFDSPYGANFASADQMYNVFVKPFTDFGKTVSAETQKMSQRTQGLLKTAIEATITSILPALGSDYKKIFESQKQKIDKITADNRAVYDATWNSFKHHDVIMAAFLMAPELVITEETIRKTPETVMSLIDVLSGGAFKTFIAKIKKKFNLGPQKQKKSIDVDDFFKGLGFSESKHSRMRLLENDNKETALVKVLTQPQIKRKIESNSQTRQMMLQARQAITTSLKETVSLVKRLKSAKTIDDLEKLIGKQTPQLEQLKRLPTEERGDAVARCVNAVMSSAKKFFTTNLKAQAKQVTDAGFGIDHPFIVAVNNAVHLIETT